MPLTAEGTSRFVQAGDVKIHYHEAGSGLVVVLIHGGAPGAYGWGNFGRNMDALAENFRTIIVDLPGYESRTSRRSPVAATPSMRRPSRRCSRPSASTRLTSWAWRPVAAQRS